MRDGAVFTSLSCKVFWQTFISLYSTLSLSSGRGGRIFTLNTVWHVYGCITVKRRPNSSKGPSTGANSINMENRPFVYIVVIDCLHDLIIFSGLIKRRFCLNSCSSEKGIPEALPRQAPHPPRPFRTCHVEFCHRTPADPLINLQMAAMSWRELRRRSWSVNWNTDES